MPSATRKRKGKPVPPGAATDVPPPPILVLPLRAPTLPAEAGRLDESAPRADENAAESTARGPELLRVLVDAWLLVAAPFEFEAPLVVGS